ncbi:MAG: LLM class flavin-dependent oxidoreductase [Thermomicrobiales bacterium]|jgi:hypothetical protein|nr:LLM class flavin-dependent oxidoreductase [Thermomicrobiales bacterium]
MTQRGFGIAAAIDPDFVEPLAVAAEAAGYATFWTNDTPGAEGLAVLGKVARVTSRIRLGVGVIPLDRRSPADIVAAIEADEVPIDRLILGVGSGGRHKGSLELVRDGLEELQRLTACRTAVGALGPKMIELSGRSNAALLNWMTAAWVESAAAGLRAAGGTEIISYVRTALPESRALLEKEAARYTAVPAYGRHFDRMGVAAFDTSAFGDADAIQAKLATFDGVLDETVVRSIVGESTLAANLALLEAAAPR